MGRPTLGRIGLQCSGHTVELCYHRQSNTLLHPDYVVQGFCIDESGQQLEVINFDFQGEPQERIAAFDRIVSRYEMVAGETINGKVKIGLILKQLPEGGLKQHLVLNLERWDTYEKLRSEVENISRAQVASQHSTIPMDLHALNPTKGSSGLKGAGKGDKGGKGSSGDTCRICGKTGHWAKDCWHKEKGTSKGKGKGKKGSSSGKDGKKEKDKSRVKCWKCGKTGHLAKECRGGAYSLTEARGWKRTYRCFFLSTPANPPVSGLFLSALHTSGTLHSVGHGKVSLGIDSGAAASVIMDNVAKDFDTVRDKTAGSYYESATGEQIEDRGQVTFACRVEQKQQDAQLRVLRVRRAQVSKNLISVDDLLAAGRKVIFERDGNGKDCSHMVHKESGLVTEFQYAKRVWELHVDILTPQRTKEIIDGAVGPVALAPSDPHRQV
eukprot:2059882-Amphidinium_carterae.1